MIWFYLWSWQRGGKRDSHVLHWQPSCSAPNRSHRVFWWPSLPLHLGDGKTSDLMPPIFQCIWWCFLIKYGRGLWHVSHSVSLWIICHYQLPSDSTRPLDEEEFSPQVRDVSSEMLVERSISLYLLQRHDAIFSWVFYFIF